MAKLVVLYKNPADKAAFDAHYEAKHVPLAKKIPGLQKYEISTGPVKLLGGESPYYLIALLHFESVDALMHGLGTPEGKAAAGDLGNFAQAGAELLVMDAKEV
ncbi:EthD family reductase [Paraburkholderia saeva]|uniref:EthD domain-containing protein n=1 Tax=Paraburkholderia saeva TaxID=2777537 RepID=A0A9N8X306_9BURK|nr:EthD family reductase [Paraburkholderia saeva]CAG4897893.1 hypothetical protein LMG31841_02533 [Paraburkholderia saeva]CAG4913072.1 hypothetical protein R52603_04092 [Paraburkholderia saeva]